MNVFEQLNETKPAVLAICSDDAEYAADFIDLDQIPEITHRINEILAHAVNNGRNNKFLKDSEFIAWTSLSQGNFIWLASFSQFLHFRYELETRKCLKSYEHLNKVSQNFDKLPIGDFSEIPNVAQSYFYALDYREVKDPYEAYALLLKGISEHRAK